MILVHRIEAFSYGLSLLLTRHLGFLYGSHCNTVSGMFLWSPKMKVWSIQNCGSMRILHYDTTYVWFLATVNSVVHNKVTWCCELLAVVLLLLHLQDERESWFLFPCVSLLHSLILRQCNVTVHFLPFRLVFHHYCIGSLRTKMLIAELMVHTQAAADRNAMLLEDNDKDKRLLRQLEKNLKMKKRKSNNLPLAFVNDGLDCILYVSARMNRHVFECLYV